MSLECFSGFLGFYCPLHVFEYKLVGPFKVLAYRSLIRRTIVLYISYLDKKVLSGSQKFILSPQNILKGQNAKKLEVGNFDDHFASKYLINGLSDRQILDLY